MIWEHFTTPFIQSILIIITGLISYFSIHKDFYSKTKRIRRTAKFSTGAIVCLCTITCFYNFIEYNSALKDKKKVEALLMDVSKKNTMLEKQITSDNEILKGRIKNSQDTLANIAADKALKASIQLKQTAENIHDDIYGGNGYLHFGTFVKGKDQFYGKIINDTKSNQYDIHIITHDYRAFALCEKRIVDGLESLNLTCVRQSMQQYSPVILKKGYNLLLENVRLNNENRLIKYYIFITTKRQSYQQEYYNSDAGEAYRLFTEGPNKKKIIISTVNKSNIKIDWEKEFSVSPYTPYAYF